jgi:ketosteroid isomerase-like protein
MRRRRSLLAAAVISSVLACRVASQFQPGPAASVDALLAADRQWSAASANVDAATAFSAMFADSVAAFLPGRPVSTTRDEAAAAMHADTALRSMRAEWTPIRAGISADGMHGFTAGYLTLRRADGSTIPQKYLSYWIKGPAGWRVAVYKRGRRPAGAGAMASLSPVLPAPDVRGTSDRATIERYRQTLDAAERAFSDDAQVVGLEKAFARHGAPDAMNMGGAARPDFVIGPAEIGKVVGVDEPATGSSVRWAPDRVLVASSGDLGITIGTIRGNEPGSNLAVAFCTVWHRRTPTEPWRYIAE